MNLAQLIAAVYTETNRPDLVAETQQAVLEATLSAHYSDFYKEDIKTAVMMFDITTNYVQYLDVRAFPNYRKMAYIRKTTPQQNQLEQNPGSTTPVTYPLTPTEFGYGWPTSQYDFMNEVDAADIIDSYGYEKTDVWYTAGHQVNLKSSTPLQMIVAGWYAIPMLNVVNNSTSYDSWIATRFPYLIIYKAAGAIFAKIGEDKAWAMYMKPGMGLYYEQLAYLQRDAIIGSGW